MAASLLMAFERLAGWRAVRREVSAVEDDVDRGGDGGRLEGRGLVLFVIVRVVSV